MPHPIIHRRLIRILQVAVLAAVTYFIFRNVVSSWDEIRTRRAVDNVSWLPLVASAVIYLVGLIPAIWFWRQVLARLGQPQPALSLSAAYFIGNLGKYIPGKAMVIVLRVAFLRNRVCTLRTAAASVFYETLTMMGVGGFLGAGIIAVLFRDRWWYVLLATVMAVASLGPTLPPVFGWLLKKLNGETDANSDDNTPDPQNLDTSHVLSSSFSKDAPLKPLANSTRKLDTSVMLAGWLAHVIGWIILGGSLWAVCQGLEIQPSESYANWPLQLAICTAAASLAMVAGFLSLIPAGVLVRESMILVVLTPVYGQSNAMLAAVVLRLVWLVAELVISGVLYATVRGSVATKTAD
ncbi:MAG: flippase-like domain-containing protein [Pirellulales bacterium]|nr:flippase-like domain-containing protein [Pirellulales bacterium]